MNSNVAPFGPAGRSQFLLGPDYLRRDTWRHLDLGDGLKLSAQANLDVEQASSGRCRLTLLGFMLDWSRPKASNAEILKSLVENRPDLDSCLKATDELGGRWILIYQNDTESVLLHDAAGLRQVCYARDSSRGLLWIGSDPGLLGEVAQLAPDPDAMTFIDSMAEKEAECWWPGNRLPFATAMALLPNHHLDLSNGSCERFWPRTALESLPEEECCHSASDKLVGVMNAAQNRWGLALGLSAGWDSRLLLAASRSIVEEILVYTAKAASLSNDHKDVVIPRRLAKRLGLNHVEICDQHHASDEFMEKFSNHTWRAHKKFAAGAQAEYEQFRYTRVAVIGNLSELAKLPYRKQTKAKEMIDGKTLAQLVGMGGYDFADEAMQEWLEDAHELAGYSLLDLFYWEQRAGRWLAANLVEFDFAWKEILVPFNIRSLICDFLATDEKDRNPVSLHLYVEIMRSLWPEVLQEPINPRPTPGFWQRVRRKTRRRLAG